MFSSLSAANNNATPKHCAGLTVAANSSSVIDYLGNVLERSKVMYDAGAYLHWYWKHGALRVSWNSCPLPLCLLGNFSCSFCRLLIFFKINFFKNSIRNTIKVSNSFDPDQA